MTWIGYHINQNEVKQIKDKTEAIMKVEAPKNVKELKSFLGSIQNLSKFINNLSKNTARKKILLKKDTSWEKTTKIYEDFEKWKKEITEASWLAHFDPQKDSYVTKDACNTSLGSHSGRKRANCLSR